MDLDNIRRDVERDKQLQERGHTVCHLAERELLLLKLGSATGRIAELQGQLEGTQQAAASYLDRLSRILEHLNNWQRNEVSDHNFLTYCLREFSAGEGQEPQWGAGGDLPTCETHGYYGPPGCPDCAVEKTGLAG